MTRNGLPLGKPGKIVCVGLDYKDHAAETEMELRERPLQQGHFSN